MSKRVENSPDSNEIEWDSIEINDKEGNDIIPDEEYSEVIVEEVNTLLSDSGFHAPSEYFNPEYDIDKSSEK